MKWCMECWETQVPAIARCDDCLNDYCHAHYSDTQGCMIMDGYDGPPVPPIEEENGQLLTRFLCDICGYRRFHDLQMRRYPGCCEYHPWVHWGNEYRIVFVLQTFILPEHHLLATRYVMFMKYREDKFLE